jgi:uncharacterized membrane protein
MVNEIISSSLPEQLIVIIIAALPVVELRGSIPVSMEVFHMSWYHSLVLSIIGNLLPIPFLLLFYDYLARSISRFNKGKKLIELLYRITRRQTCTVEKYKHLGLIMLVAIPLPGTGAWTGSIVAHLIGMKFKHAFFGIALGVIVAGTAVTTLVLLGWVGAGIALLGIITFAAVSLWQHFKSQK